jgi:regulator of RNase E activity RraB
MSIVNDAWNIYHFAYGDEDEYAAIIRFDEAAAQEERHRGYEQSVRVVVYIPLETVTSNGLPASATLPDLRRLEEELVQRLRRRKVDCRLVGVMTYGGLREFVFQVQDRARFGRQIARWMKGVEGFKIELKESEGWDFFDRKVRPSPYYQVQILDRTVVERLIEAGSDPDAPHLLEHAFKGPPEALERLQRELAAEGFEELRDQRHDDWLVMARESALDSDQITELTVRLRIMGERLGAEYDGWGAAVVR